MNPRFLVAGDRGLIVELGDSIDPTLNAQVRALDAALRASPFEGYQEAIPAFRSLFVVYEPRSIHVDHVCDHLRDLVSSLDATKLPPAPLKQVPTVYDGEDLDDVASRVGVSCEELVRLHSERDYAVFMMGFIPGFAYMGSTDSRLALVRRATPRTRVPAGSVAIAMGQTGIYPAEAPGGWHLLGRAEHRALFDPDAMPPTFLEPGDRVRFVPVERLPQTRAETRADAGADTGPDSDSSDQETAAAIRVEDGGLLTTVQDLGRPGFQRYGVPVGGAMDARALAEANRLVGNEGGAAALECTVVGPTLRCLRSTMVSVTGADLGAAVERSDLGRWRPRLGSSFRLRPGNVLSFEGRRSGARAYVAFEGGLDVPPVLGSRSTYLMAGFGGYCGRPLTSGDTLGLLGDLSPATHPSHAPPSGQRGPNLDEMCWLRIVWGPQDDYFTEEGCRTLESSVFTVGAAADRMGYRLEGPTLEHRDRQQIISDGNALGSIQVPPDGLPIVMMADRATTGGYPKIATVVAADIPQLAQRLPGETVRFKAVSLDTAYSL